jgi:hypothetical protein
VTIHTDTARFPVTNTDVVPAHIADDLEAVREHLRTAALLCAPAARPKPRAMRKVRHPRKAHDPIHVAGVGGGVDVQGIDAGPVAVSIMGALPLGCGL